MSSSKSAKKSSQKSPNHGMNHQHHLIINYFLLLFIFLTGGLSLLLIQDRQFNLFILIALMALYMVWGIWHHSEHETLSKEVVLEYAGVAGLVAMIYLLIS